MAQATVEERELLKAMTWWDGFVVALANPGFLIASLGFTITSLGAWAIVVWGISMLIGALSAWIYSEPATMFPEKSGGISLYAHEGWKKYSSLVGPIATFGYWFAWSSVLAIFGLLIGSLIQSQWFSETTWSADIGWSTLNLAKVIGAVAIVAVWIANSFGIRPAVWAAYVTGALLMVPLAIIIIGPYLTGDFDSGLLDWDLLPGGWGSWELILVWLYIMGWSSYGVETCAVFAPEYQDPVRDTPKALRTSSMFSLAVYILLPLGIVGTLTGDEVADGVAGPYLVTALREVVGIGSGIGTLLLIAGLVLSMNTATMDGSRALYGIARDGMTIRQLGVLNRYNVPARAMGVDAVVNLALLFFFDNTLGILAAGNLGYILAHALALSAVLLLRKDRPLWPRPVRLSSPWLVIAGILCAANLLFIVVGFNSFELTGYASAEGERWLGIANELWIGVAILLVGVALFVYRRIAQDRQPLTWSEPAPVAPEEASRTRA